MKRRLSSVFYKHTSMAALLPPHPYGHKSLSRLICYMSSVHFLSYWMEVVFQIAHSTLSHSLSLSLAFSYANKNLFKKQKWPKVNSIHHTLLTCKIGQRTGTVRGRRWCYACRFELCGLNIGHGTFGVGVEAELDVGRGHVSFLILIPAHSSPAIAFVLLDYIQHLAFRHWDGALVLTLRVRREKKPHVLVSTRCL